MKVPFQGRTTYYDTFRFVEPCFGLWFDGCLDFFAMIFPVVYIGAIAVSFLFVVMMFHIQIAEIHEEVLRYLPEDYNEEDDRPAHDNKEKQWFESTSACQRDLMRAFQGIQLDPRDELGFQQHKPPPKRLPSSAFDYCYDRSSLRGSTQAIALPPLLMLWLTPQADSSNPTLSKEKKSWDYDLLSAGLLVVIGWTLSSSKVLACKDKMTLIFTSMEPDVSLSPTDLTQKESMGVDTSIAADAEEEILALRAKMLTLPWKEALLSLPSPSSGYGRRNREEGRIPSPILTKKLKEASKTEERVESEEERDVEIERASEMKGTKQEQEGSTEEDPSPSLFSEERWDPDKIDETEEISRA
ncbi:hypothetical protein KY290_025143 [Solanum tuberosum]|uniref:Protein TIC 214 n=1 Tax=Solanum tuberosum TaxID=4113 RepID=A0ABQ7UTX6_SOLTU|nr:hypothetical protein KY284_032322 [Solanum tuberosum]KAH0674810.1 hypothetical protein KY284_025897 [Solanum tuberosum]KAH0677128.1 hypothetical protein KY285_024929 [Solanum tuberosum]KAH0754873.1 hypothetical protein KY290_025143 [Solanum tuberosum]